MNNTQIRCLQMLVLLIATALMLVASSGPALIPGHAPPMDPLSLVTTFHNAINSDDVDAVLALFADDATVNDNGSVIEGKELIRDGALHSQRTAGTRRTF
jgi:hypothetical protein